MQRERFQEYLYKPDKFKNAGLSELKDLLREYPWFTTAANILLVYSKLQSDPEFDSLLKKLSINITNRKYLQKLLRSGFENDKKSTGTKSENIIFSDPGFHNKVKPESVQETTPGNENHKVTAPPDILDDDSLLDFSYSSKKEGTPDTVIKEGSEAAEYQEKVPSLQADQNFDRWIDKLSGDSWVQKSPHKKHHIIESFIHSDPGVIRADKVSGIEGDVSKSSVEENEEFITDTLAKIYIKQGLYNKAIFAYEKLCLKYPEKSIYFASQIEEIKSLYIKN